MHYNGAGDHPRLPHFFMLKGRQAAIVGLFLSVLVPPSIFSQSSSKPATPDSGSATSHGLDLAEKGHCKEALPILKKSAPLTADKQLKLKAGVATIRCALGLGQEDAAVGALLWLNRVFPDDPEVLYITTHAYSDLSTRASLRLAQNAPSSYQAHELNAEAMEMQGKWDDAISEYRLVLQQEPQLSGIHFRIGRAILSKPETPTTGEDARKEFEEELKIDPRNAAAEYVLGELSSQQQQWEDAILHFSQAAKLDSSFVDAYLGLGGSYVSTGKFTEAIEPLEKYVKLQPGNPAGHYQLAIAYSRAGRKEEAKREAALQKETSDRIEQEKQKAADALQKQAAGQDAQKPPPQN
jgi:tetratricopeptide (TPR) repeat protein